MRDKTIEFFAKHDLLCVQHNEHHYQIKGGKFLVNFYPIKKSYYIQGANKKSYYVDLKHLLRIAIGEADIAKSSAGGKRKGSSKNKRQALWNAGHRTCFVCEKPLTSPEESTLEHKVPLNKGGSNRRDNLTLSHKDCNHMRGNDLSLTVVKNKFEALFYGANAKQTLQSHDKN